MKLNSVFILAFVILFSACSSTPLPAGPGTYLPENYAVPAKGSLIILLPPISIFPEFTIGEEPVNALVNQKLMDAGYKTLIYPRKDLVSFWHNETAALGNRLDPQLGQHIDGLNEHLTAKLVRIIAKEHPDALILSQRIVARKAQLKGASATWDGRKTIPPAAGTSGQSGQWSGSTPALSLEITALDKTGKEQFKTFGGLLLPYRANVIAENMAMRDGLFQKQSEFAAGIDIALSPLTKTKN